MSFVRNSASTVPLDDTVFAVAMQAKEDRARNGALVTDATIGSLFDEEGHFVAFKSVFDHYDHIPSAVKGAYAAGFQGNPDYCDAVYRWVTHGADSTLAHAVIATPGGSGAVASALLSCLDEGETVIIPDIAWESYELMASTHNFRAITYEMFAGDRFNLKSVQQAIEEVLKTQKRVVLVINDPCHNPTGYSMTSEEWETLVEMLNEAGKTGPVVLINDIAYIDYSFRKNQAREYLHCFNRFSEAVMAVVAFSCSKSLTSYGLRCGAAILLAQKETDVRDTATVFERSARAIWSNIPNAAMANFTWVVNDNKEAYLEEKQKYVDLLKQRSDILVSEAKECGLDLYPYREGFFITIRMKDNKERDALHAALIQEHIYTVKVNRGIRIAVCSLPVPKAKGLSARIKAVQDGLSAESE